jgi:hypothetical protein
MIDGLSEAGKHFVQNKNAKFNRVVNDSTLSYSLDGVEWWLQFKRDFYRNFGFHFREKGLSGYGEIISYSILKAAVDSGVSNMVVVLPDGAIYQYSPNEVLEFVERNDTVVPHLPEEVAFPIKMLVRVNKFQSMVQPVQRAKLIDDESQRSLGDW